MTDVPPPGIDKRMQKVTVVEHVYYEVWVNSETLATARKLVREMIEKDEDLGEMEVDSTPFEVVEDEGE
jgi:hypothetical protein